ncbi:MAG: hypothetical protein JNK04_02980 [Myxococcales bacterium]|nr:hypothetical protein [Myxococcales bacterium]
MHRSLRALPFALVLSLAGCGDDSPNGGAPAGGGGEGAQAGAPGNGGGGNGPAAGGGGNGDGGAVPIGGAGGENAGGAGGGPPAIPCTPDKICLDISPKNGVSAASGRLVVLWFQLNDNGPDPIPLIGYDAPLDGSQSTAEIPLADIAIPPDELLLCERACDEELECPCADPDVAGGIGLILVVSEEFAADPTLPFSGNVFGVAPGVATGYGPTEQVPPHPDLIGKFPDGIHEGVWPYLLQSDGTFDDLYFSTGTEVFDLEVCPTEASCGLPFPNLS